MMEMKPDFDPWGHHGNKGVDADQFTLIAKLWVYFYPTN